MANAQAVDLKPVIEARCVICGGGGRELICNEEELRAQAEYLREFHRRRVRSFETRSGDNVLADRSDFTQNYTTDVVECLGCGLVLRDHRPPAADVLDAYTEDEYGSERLTELFTAQLQASRVKARQLRRYLPSRRPPSIIEVGSFVGGFLAAAAELGWEAVGLDPGEEVVEFCRAKGLRVLRSAAEAAPIEAGTADCVAIWNTFDQLPDPRLTLAAARRWLRRDGLLIIRVPNGAAFRAAMRWRRTCSFDAPLMAALAWNNLLAFPYLYGYSVTPLDRLVGAFGFTRRALRPDTLVQLADRKTAAWAAYEEWTLKAMWRVAARLDAEIAPWLDVYYSPARRSDG